MSQYNRVYVRTATVGQGTLTLGAALGRQFCTFAEAGAADGEQIRSYIIEENADFEINVGIYNSAGPTLTRGTPRLSKIAGVVGTTKMTLGGNATVRLIAAKEDLVTQDTNGNVALTGALSISPPASSLIQGLAITQSPTGTIAGGTPFTFTTANAANYINITSESVNMGDSNEYSAFAIIHKTGGAGAVGMRSGLHVEQWLTAAAGAGTSKDMSGATFQLYALDGNNGGTFIAQSTIAFLSGTGAGSLIGHEIDIEAAAGSSVLAKYGLEINQVQFDAVQGSVADVGILFFNGGSSGGWKNGIYFSPSTVSPGGVVLDASALTIGSPAYFLKGPGSRFVVDGNGNIAANTIDILPGSSTPIIVSGLSSGQGTFSVPAALGSANWTLPTNTGTFAVSATSPLVLNAATGNLTFSKTVPSGDIVGTTDTQTLSGKSFTGTTSFTQAAGTAISVLSGASGSFARVTFGRTATEGQIGIGAAADQFTPGVVAGDLAIQAATNLWLATNGAAGASNIKSGIKIDTSGLVTLPQYGAGVLTTDSNGLISASVTLDTDATLAANSATRIPAQSAVKSYIDNSITGIKWKASVLCATTANITISGEQTIDGATTSASRVLVKNQSTGSQNGIYVSAAGAWTRSTDADTAAEITQATMFVQQGAVNGDTQWTCTTDNITLGTTALVFGQVSGAGTYSAGTGLTLSGNQFLIDSTVVTLTGAQALSNKSFVAPALGTPASGVATNLTGTAASLTAGGVTANAITRAMEAQGVARSVIGVTGNATANVADIQGTTDQVLRVNGAGTALAFGAIDLSKTAAATGVLQAASFPALTGDVTTAAGALAATLATAQPGAHTWAAIQTLTLAPVFTDQSGSRTALGLGTAATQNTGTSGANLPFLNGTNTWANPQTFSAAINATTVTATSAYGTADFVGSANKTWPPGAVAAATTVNQLLLSGKGYAAIRIDDRGYTGDSASYLVANGVISLGTVVGSTFVADTATPANGKASIHWDSGTNSYRIYFTGNGTITPNFFATVTA